ncbi:Cys-tRNA(Pro) deacylase [Sporanaerobium hydrogeniformans]|uniref:Cys-tRNA(Pro) deacylase n=1 Tax=Sporanaerobium hydrogeniformans TaxID=3072179 RepID=A0AC61DFM2_9FIRM|nr:Cys-tRNA(Pro) deacylase [Lachnospiraceae bacterium]PHV71705.1 Cys-tRNA(Pro) deacylase [Sporanaerobium hydrogeniformans]
MGIAKTNVMRLLDKEKIPYEITSYDISDGKIDGVAVAAKIGKAPEQVYKTLVVCGHSKNYYVFVIPVIQELDLKKASKIVGEKNIEMLHVKDLQKVTGYIRGGCSPIGMKKQFKTYIHEAAKSQQKITFSAGKVGFQVTIAPEHLSAYINGDFADLVID